MASSCFGGLAPEMIGASLDVFEHPGVDVAASCPREPVAVRHAEMDVYHPVEECRRHWLNDRRVLGAVAGTNHDRTLRKLVVADPSFVDEAVKRLLNFVAAGVELVEEEALWSLAGDHRRRAETALTIHDLRHAEEILGRELASQEGHARQPHTPARSRICRYAVPPR